MTMDYSPLSEREIWPFLKEAISLELERPYPPKLVCMHLTSTPTCMNFLSRFYSVLFLTLMGYSPLSKSTKNTIGSLVFINFLSLCSFYNYRYSVTKSNTFSHTFNVQSGAIKYLEHVVLTVSFGITVTVSLYLVLSSHILSL